MKKLIICLIVLLIPLKAFALSTSATSSILYDQDSGRILYANNIDNVRGVASISKIMTAILACESGKLDDVVPINDWIVHRCDINYEERFHLLQRLVQPLELPNITPITSSQVFLKVDKNTIPKILDLFHQFISQGWEGAMIKDLDAPYQWKRTKALLKMKLMDTVDLPVMEMYEGTGKYINMMGGVYCDYKGNKLGVGSGFTDEQRQKFWSDPNQIVGKTIEVAYQAETTNKHGQKSLSFPIFKQVRNDK